MSHRRHHHHDHHCSPSCCCCTNTAPSCHCCSNTPPPPSPTNADHLLQTLILLQSQQPQGPIFLSPHPQSPRRPGPKHRDASVDGGLPSILRSLARRVAALESSLPRHPPPSQEQRRQSLRDAAAATIQRHFRRFLARRSRALRDLKQLASVRSHAAALRSSLSDRTRPASPRRVSERAGDLLLQLDSVQSSDPMIREGKRSVSRELVRISEFVDKVLIKESSDSQSQLEELERRRDRGRRRVSFAECNGKEDNLFDDFPERIADIEEEALRGFYDRSSDNEESPKAMRHERANGFSQRMAPPLPVRMEPMRNGSMKKMVADEED